MMVAETSSNSRVWLSLPSFFNDVLTKTAFRPLKSLGFRAQSSFWNSLSDIRENPRCFADRTLRPGRGCGQVLPLTRAGTSGVRPRSGIDGEPPAVEGPH